ncbi:flagellar hook-associated protein 1 FlgK [Arthrobacter sp. V4I6]|uniref:flagellar hook-associated protein FlgK n=1 Tax=unclassified Arthrobacter TaxID=235627 RepID=UPI00278A7420|nr:MULTISPECIES: flagellar hook-associated protein FlgK [unclassified Arthrobacter]MDQ0822700.1 flagellar hook-associated protein 1 FlgK [Arthrobacter sp. V1I7]MDQ0852328.1 flagellar hook-associated protein 1 FlgK [Arthrobacter sp. V4I6]
MSTFGALNTAYRGLTAAQQGMNVAGQNIANAATEGYTRQRVQQSSNAAPGAHGLNGSGRPEAGQGVSVDAIARIGNSFLDAGVRSAGAQAGYASVRSSALQGIEGILQEPGDNGISTALHGFWSAWQGVANQPDQSGPKGLLLNAANSVTDKISSAYKALDSQWSSVRAQASDNVNAVNAAAAQVAAYNTTIRSTLAAGGSANELIDARAKLTDQIASLAGGSVREKPDGTLDVLIGGNALVTGGSFRTLKLVGATAMADAATDAPRVEWTNPSGTAALDGGELAGALSVLAPADKGGAIAQAAQSYNTFATTIATAVNTVHRSGVTGSGATNVDFFTTTGTGPAALSIAGPANVDNIALKASTGGALDTSIADKISQLGTGAGSPDKVWAGIVTNIGVQSRGAQQHESLSSAAEISAQSSRASQASVSLDEENIRLLANQHAYQAAARVMTAVDEALDVLINRTGLVGR